MKHRFLVLLALLLAVTAHAAAPRLTLDVATFQNADRSRKGGVLEVYATVDGNSLVYQRRAPKMYQASAVLTLEVLAADGKIVYSETLKLKPPVLRDTSLSIKNPLSFQKRVLLTDGSYTVRGTVRDQYQAGGNRIVDVPVQLQFDQPGLRMSDVVVLAKAPGRSPDDSNFSRGGYLLVRTPGGLYGRGADHLYAYAEMYNAPQTPALVAKLRLRPVGGTKDVSVGAGIVKAQEGTPHVLLLDLDIAKLPAGEYNLIVEVRGTKNKLLATKTTRVLRQPDVYAPAAAAIRL